MENNKVRIPTVFKVAGVSFHKKKLNLYLRETYLHFKETQIINMTQTPLKF